jgi:hypothetical protein
MIEHSQPPEVKTMTHLSQTERLEFVQSLELEQPKPRTRGLEAATEIAPPKITAEEDANYINDGSLVSFVAGLSVQDKSDVLNGVLLAQKAANTQHNRYSEPEAWYASYREVLTKIGWTGGADSFQKFDANGETVQVQNVVLTILAGLVMGGPAIAAITQALNALKGLSKTDSRFTLWDQSSHSQTAGNFQIAASAKSTDGLVLNLGTFYFSAIKTDTHFLFFDFSSTGITLFTGAQQMVLNTDVYAQVRQVVIEKLGVLANEFVANLPKLQ